MTSPSVDILNGALPYGVTVEGKGQRNAEIITESDYKNSNVALKLPDGPCRVAASWDGPESVRLVHSGHGYPVVIPAGGVSFWDGYARRYNRGDSFPAERFFRTPRTRWPRHNRGVPTPATLTRAVV